MKVPFSVFEAVGGLDHPFSWCARVQERYWGKHQYTIWFNGSEMTQESVARRVERHYPGVECLRIERVTKQPTAPLQPIPQHFFQFQPIFEYFLPVPEEPEVVRDSLPLSDRYQPLDSAYTPLEGMSLLSEQFGALYIG